MTMAQDIDFENFKVETDRATQIREHLARMKSENWMNDLKILVLELGEESKEKDEEAGLIPGLVKDQKIMVYRTPLDHAAGAWTFKLSGTDFRVFLDETSVVEISFLPKADDFLLMYVNETLIDRILTLRESLTAEIKAARAKKTQRQATFKAAFNKS